MAFSLIIRPEDDDPAERFLEYITSNEPIITRRHDGGIDVGMVSFKTLKTQVIPFSSLKSIAKYIAKLTAMDSGYALGVLFEQTAGNPIIVAVEVGEIDALTTILDTGFSGFPNIGAGD